MSALLRVFIALVLVLNSFLFFTSQSLAYNDASASAQMQVVYTKDAGSDNLYYPGVVIYNVLFNLNCLLNGYSLSAEKCPEISVINDGVDNFITISKANSNKPLSLLDISDRMVVTMLTTPPLKTEDFLADFGKELGIVGVAKAQVAGSGSDVLGPIYPLWKVSRNIAYVLLIIVFVFVGIMIMLRNKVNPQTVISIQYAMPGLILGLIFITFSYFIASLITDIAFLGTDLVGFYFSLTGATALTKPLTDVTNGVPLTTIFSSLISGIFQGETLLDALTHPNQDILHGTTTVYDSLRGLPKDTVDWIIRFGTFQLGSAIGSPVVNTAISPLALLGGAGAVAGSLIALFSGFATGLLGVAIGVGLQYPAVITLVMTVLGSLMLLYSMMRLFFKLIINYLTIIFLTVTAPFTFLISSLPGRQNLATEWMMNMLCNVLAFPAVMAALYFVAYMLGPVPNQFSNVFEITARQQVNGQSTFPLLGGYSLNFLNIMLAFGTLIATPAIPDIICRLIGKVGPAGQLIEGEYNTAQRQGSDYQGRLTRGTSNVLNQWPDARGREAINRRFFDAPHAPYNPLRWIGL